MLWLNCKQMWLTLQVHHAFSFEMAVLGSSPACHGAPCQQVLWQPDAVIGELGLAQSWSQSRFCICPYLLLSVRFWLIDTSQQQLFLTNLQPRYWIPAVLDSWTCLPLKCFFGLLFCIKLSQKWIHEHQEMLRLFQLLKCLSEETLCFNMEWRQVRFAKLQTCVILL